MTMDLARAARHVLVWTALVSAFAATPAGAAKAPPTADVAVELTTAPFGAGLGEAVEHRIAVRNRGPATAADIAVSFTTSLPIITPKVEDGGGHCTFTDATTLSCRWSKLRPTDGATPLTVVLRGKLGDTPPLGGLVRNTATVGTAAPEATAADGTSANAYLLASVPVAENAPVQPAPVGAAPTKPSPIPLFTLYALLAAMALAVIAAGSLARRRDPFAALREPAKTIAERLTGRFARRRPGITEQAGR
ncbi:hypothetical protein AB0I28_13930 [Phytomonospora sp. NPDC050363]|uniref:hypothetical protein n=1 Tax=Phytomonospora sp. NPDC050363 TaxID=3155642 RepID=UPI0033EAD035